MSKTHILPLSEAEFGVIVGSMNLAIKADYEAAAAAEDGSDEKAHLLLRIAHMERVYARVFLDTKKAEA